MNDFLKLLFESYSGKSLEDYNNLCEAVEGFIHPSCIHEDFNPFTFDYDDVEDEIIFIIQESLENDFNMLKALSIEGIKDINAKYLSFDKSAQSIILSSDILFDELELAGKECETFLLLEKFVDKINKTTTLRLELN